MPQAIRKTSSRAPAAQASAQIIDFWEWRMSRHPRRPLETPLAVRCAWLAARRLASADGP